MYWSAIRGGVLVESNEVPRHLSEVFFSCLRLWHSIVDNNRTTAKQTKACPMRVIDNSEWKEIMDNFVCVCPTGRRCRHWLDIGIHAKSHQSNPQWIASISDWRRARAMGCRHLLHCVGHVSLHPGSIHPEHPQYRQLTRKKGRKTKHMINAKAQSRQG